MMIVAVLFQLLSTAFVSFGYWLIHKKFVGVGNALICVSSGTLGSIALKLAPQSLVAPLGSLTVVWSALLARLEGRKPNWFAVFRVIVCCFVLVIIFIPSPPTVPNLTDAWLDVWGPVPQIWASFVAIWVLARQSTVEAAVLGGVTAGFTDTLAKAFLTWFDARIAVLIVAPCLVQVACLNWLLSNDYPEKYIPLYATCCIASIVFMGVLAFQEFTHISTEKAIVFVLCFLVGLQAANQLHRQPPTHNVTTFSSKEEEESDLIP